MSDIYFVLSSLMDLVLFITAMFLLYKIFKIKIVSIENNQEIYEHDKTLSRLEKEVDRIKNKKNA